MPKKRYRPAASYIGKTEEAKAKQLENLARGRLKRARKVLVRPPDFMNPEYETDIIKFLEEQFFIPETRKPIVLEDYQKEEILRPLFYTDQRPTMALFGQTKKSGKSTLAAGIASWFLYKGEDWGEIYLAARDKDQATWIVFSKLVKGIEMNKQMLLRVKIGKDSIERTHTGSVVRCLPTDVSCAGLNPNLTIFDELWSYEYESMIKFFEEMTTVPTRKHPLILIVSYAGYDTDEDDLLYSFYQKGLKNKGKKRDKTFFFYWDHRNRMPWQTKQYLKQQRSRLRKGTYLRLHENKFTSGEESFLDMELWDVCVDPEHRPMLPDRNIGIVVGVDIGISFDSCAVVAVTKEENKIKLVCHRKWQPSKENPIDLEETVEAYIKGLREDYMLLEVRYDPFQFHRSATTLGKEGINMVEFPQTQDRLTSMSQNLYDLIKGENLVLYKDKDMRSAAKKSVAKEVQRGWRIVKAKATHKIDLIISLAMAALGALKIEDAIPESEIYSDEFTAL